MSDVIVIKSEEPEEPEEKKEEPLLDQAHSLGMAEGALSVELGVLKEKLFGLEMRMTQLELPLAVPEPVIVEAPIEPIADEGPSASITTIELPPLPETEKEKEEKEEKKSKKGIHFW